MRGTAVVVGAGIGGLAVARALTLAGWDVEVRERAPAPPPGGTALGMWPEALAALDRLGLGDAVRRRSVAPRGAALLRPDGRVLAGGDAGGIVRLVSRGALLETLCAGVPDGVVRWSTPVESPADLPPADLVVAADGIGSAVRAAHWSVAPRRLGTVAFRGTVPGTVDRVTETWGRGRLFGITPNGDGTTNWFASVRADRAPSGDDPAVTPTALRALYGGWHADVASVLEAIQPGGVDRRRLADIPPLGRYVHANVALLGDAAHAMAPNLGRGACETLVDAVALADALSASATLPEALGRYDRARRGRTRRLVRLARLVNTVSTAEHGVGLRDLALSAAGAGRRAATLVSHRGPRD